MLLNEFYKPKINNSIETAATKYLQSKKRAYDGGDAYKNLMQAMSKMGWIYLDSGAFSKVFVHPKKKYVIKINSTTDNAYRRYVYVIHKFRSPHFPKISDLKKIEINGDEYYVYLIEKLQKITGPFIVELSKNIKQIAVKPNATLKNIYYNDYYEEQEEIPEFILQNPSLVRAARIIGRRVAKEDWVDLNTGNIMKREDGTIVITDPYAG
jgi:hypothetical protein